ncbi:MAG: flagellar filament capping protein FliD [Pontiellaceae bacterium]|nr:flagellar filament capping protein FliD [Pontiellaceae bacterium]MBN2784171.1 flagellar filament capping protein FliD [Pontiellaceae bacterium]
MPTLHIGGLSSGYDYESMIEQLMAARQVSIDSKSDDLDELDYDLGAWTQINTDASSLTDALDDLRSFDLWRNMYAESSYESVVTATADVASAEQNYTIKVTNIATAQSISSDYLDTSTDLITAGYASEGDIFEIEGQQITFESGETLSTLRTKINDAAANMDEDVRVKASIVDNHLVITREKTGASDISLSDVSGLSLESMGVLTGGLIKNEDVEGLDANFSVNGITITRSSNDQLDDVVDGLTINLKGAGTSTVDIHPDRDAIKESILNFIETYNTLAELADECASISLGSSSELAQKGELYGDSLINSIKSSLRQQATDVKSSVLTADNASYTYAGQTGIMDNLSDIGIWTSGESNQLELIDEDRLDYLLEYDFDNVSQLFRGVYNESTVSYEGGIAADFYKYASKLSTPLTGDIATQIASMTEDYDDLSDRITEMEDDLADYEQQLWEEFTAMEDALAEMKQQTEYIKGMFSSGS